MQLIGYLDSPFVRRVAVTMRFLGVEYEHRELSIFRNFDEFRAINPLVKVPTLVLDDGQVLTDSTLIIDYVESQLAGRSLMPAGAADYRAALGLIGVALVAMEKVAQLLYETAHRPEEKQHGPWVKRLEQQLSGAAALMESAVNDQADGGQRWLFGEDISQADISIAVAWRFMLHVERARVQAGDFPALDRFSRRAEAMSEFTACPLAG